MDFVVGVKKLDPNFQESLTSGHINESLLHEFWRQKRSKNQIIVSPVKVERTGILADRGFFFSSRQLSVLMLKAAGTTGVS